MSNHIVLLKTMLLSTSNFNKAKYSKDKKKKKRAVGALIGLCFLYLMLMTYCIAACVGYGLLKMQFIIPDMCALVISIVAFFFTLLKTNGYLFNFKEYDMLMSLPFAPKTIAMDKFLYMYIKSIPWYLSISIAMMLGYAVFEKPPVAVYFYWLVLSLIIPVIPMVVAAFLGFLIAKLSSKSKKTNIVQTILSFALIIFCFSIRFIIEGIVRNNQTTNVLEAMMNKIKSAENVYLPMKLFSNAINQNSFLAFGLFILLSLGIFEIAFIPVGKSYRSINSALRSNGKEKAYKMGRQKKTSVVNAIAFKEFKRFLGSTIYLTNAGMGEVFVVIIGLASLFVGIDKVIAMVVQDAPVTAQMLYPAFPLIIYFFIGMVSTTVMSPSLEGKNYWIVQSLPINKKVLYQGKMLFNMYLTVPFTIFGTLCLCISARTPFVNILIYIVQGILLCAFSTCWGCVCGIKHLKLDWENEVEVVKQGIGVVIYLFPNMFVTMGLVVLVVFLSTIMNSILVSLILSGLVALLTVICYLRVLALAQRN